jgi:peptidoglycan hydrolase FlgJ
MNPISNAGLSSNLWTELSSKLDSSSSIANGEKLQDLSSVLGESKPVDETRQAFDQFVGQTFFSQLIASMRTAQTENAYFNGGQAEKIFQGQLDQVLADEMTKASASQIADPMFELFQLRRNG